MNQNVSASNENAGKPGLHSRIRAIPRWLIWTSGLLLFYTLMGFFFLPWFGERQLRSLAEERLALQLSVERIYFNPFTMLLRVEDLSVTDPGQGELLSLGLLHSNFSPLRLATLKLHFSEFSVADVDVTVERSSETENTISSLAARWAGSAEAVDSPANIDPESTAAEAGSLIPLEVEVTRLENLNLHIRDEVPAEPFASTLTLANAQVDGLSSIENQPGSKSLLLHFDNGASLELSGELQLNPLELSGQISLQNFTVDPLDHYLRQNFPFSLSDGSIDFASRYDLRLAGQTPRISLDGIAFSLSDLEVTQPSGSDAFFTLAALQLENGRFAYPENTVALPAVTLSGPRLTVQRDARGEINLLQMLDAMAIADNDNSAPEPSAGGDSAPGWDLSLDSFTLDAGRLTLLDAAISEPATLSADLAVQVRDISNRPDAMLPFQIAVASAGGGDVSVSGSLGLLPELRLQADAEVNALDLTVLQPYLNEVAFLALQSGTLAGALSLQSVPEELLRVRGGVQLDGFSLAERQQGETLLNWQRIEAEGIDFDLDDSAVEVSELIFDQLFSRLIINADGSTNIARSLKPAAETDAATPGDEEAESSAQTESPAFVITLGRIVVNDASSDFTDLDLPIVFNANIAQLNGVAEGFSTNSSEPLALELEGVVDEFGQLQLSSALNPFDPTRQSTVELEFRNLDMPSVSPYTIKFAGREIADGTVDINLSYLVDAGQLDANNRVVLRDLRLGERIEQPGAMELPLDLALALLKDSAGVIDLEVPVAGDVNDPQFDLGPAIRTAITNTLTNIVAAPFRLLGSLVGGGDDSLEQLHFEPGSAVIAPPEQQVLQQLVTALAQRPELVLEIPPLQGEGDRAALQTQAVSQRIDNLLAQGSEEQGSLTQRRLAIVEELYGNAALEPALAELRLANTRTAEAVAAQAEDPAGDRTSDRTRDPNLAAAIAAASAEAKLDVPAYVADIRRRLVAAEPVGDAEMEALARSRARAIRDYLAAQGLDVAARTRVTEPQLGELDENGRLTLEFGLTAQSR